MSYLVLARKWRPQSFKDLVGQETTTRILKNAIEMDRVPHAMIFTGTRGVGKTTSARIMAKALNCEQGPKFDPCGTCSNCKEISSSSSVDVLEIDGASNTSVDDVRELREGIQYSPSKSRFKIYIIDEVHMLSNSAFNALLKTLEEPPSHVKFIFATTEPQKIPDTILSRCQRFDFKEVSEDHLFKHLKFILAEEKVKIEEAAIRLVARQAAGSVRDGLSTLDQVIALKPSDEGEISGKEVAALLGLTDESLLNSLMLSLVEHNTQTCLQTLQSIFSSSTDLKSVLLQLLDWCRDLLMVKAGVSLDELNSTQVRRAFIQEQLQNVEQEELERWFDLFKRCLVDMRQASFQKTLLEVVMIRASKNIPRAAISDILNQLEGNPKKMSGFASPAARSGDFETSDMQKPLSTPSGQNVSLPTEQKRELFRNEADILKPKKEIETPTPSQETGSAAPLKDNSDWGLLLAAVKKLKPSMAAILMQAKVQKLDQEKLLLQYDGQSFYLSRAKENSFKDFLDAQVKALFDRKIQIIVESTGAPEVREVEAPQKSRSDKESEVLKHPKIQEALSLFDAKVEEVSVD